MIKILKSNKTYILLLITFCFIFILSPSVYIQSSLDAISLWAMKVVPSLLPFFIITRIIVGIVSMKPNQMDKLMNKIYHTGSMSSIVLFLSIISGYPMGAKLICSLHENDQIEKKEATKLLSICSVSGPMFMVGTVGVGILISFKAGIIILISNIISSLINGFIYRGEPFKIDKVNHVPKTNHNLLYDAVHDALNSILLIGGFMLFSFLIIDVLNNLNLTNNLSNAICSVFQITEHHDIVNSIFNGSIEITRGIVDLARCDCTIEIKTIISSTLIAFGGLSIMMQSISFLSKLNISIKTMLKQKFTQSLICFVVTALICLVAF